MLLLIFLDFTKLIQRALFKKSTNKFIHRFNQIEKHIEDAGGSIEKSDLETMDKIWNQVKENEKK